MLRSPYFASSTALFTVISVTLIVVFLHLVGNIAYLHQFGSGNGTYEIAREALFQEANLYKACVKAKLLELPVPTGAHKVWNNLLPAVRACFKYSRFESLPITTYSNNDEDKFYLHDDYFKEQKSVVVTIGVGQDARAEAKMKKYMSNDTEFFGADPMPENLAIYSPVGAFHQFAITNVTKIKDASVLASSGVYETRTILHKDMLAFLRELVQRDTIDNMLLDSEGAEYDIIPMFFRGREFDQVGFTLCQLNAEFHSGNFVRFDEIIRQLIEDAKYIPIRIEEIGHYRLFMVNIESPYCVNRYLAKYFV